VKPLVRHITIVFVIAAAAFFTLSLLFVFLQIFNVGIGGPVRPLEIANTVVLTTPLVALAIFYIITGIRILRKLVQSAKLSHRKRRIKRVCSFVCVYI
jgi:hypothetical protein